MRNLTCDPKAEVIGIAMLSILDNLRADEIRPVLQKQGLEDISPDEWYPAHQWLGVMNDLAAHTDLMSNLVAIGLKIAEYAILPPDLTCLEELLMMFDAVYQMNHRNGEIGHFISEQVGDKHFKIYFEDIYPDDLTYGILYGFTKRFLPQGTPFTLKYENPALSRDRGGSETIVHVEWD